MSSQYGSLRSQYPSTVWTVAAVAGGNLTTSGTIGLRIQGHNRVGLNLLSERKEVSYTAGQKIVVTFLNTLPEDGEEVFKLVLSGETTGVAQNSVQLAEVNTRLNSQVAGSVAFPLVIELTRDEHLNLTQQVANTNSFPSFTLLGMVRQIPNGDVYRWNGTIWEIEQKGRLTYLASTKGARGCDQSTATAIVLIPPPIKTDANLTSSPVVMWWSHGAQLDSGTSLPKGFALSLEISIDGQGYSTQGIPYLTVFDGLIYTKFLGVVNRFTGEFELVGNDFSSQWHPYSSGMKAPYEILSGRALAYEVSLDFSNAVLAPFLNPDGSVIGINIVRQGMVGVPLPAGSFTGDVIFPQGDRLRIVPNKRLGGGAVLSGGGDQYYQVPYSDIEYPILGLQPNTTGQKVVLNPAAGAAPVVKAAAVAPEIVRAVVGTAAGEQALSGWVNFTTPTGAGISLTVNHPCDEQGRGTIRANYPDSTIALNAKADFVVPEFFVYLDYQSGNGDRYLKFGPFPVMPLPEQVITISSASSGTEVLVGALPTSASSFGLFGYGTLEPSAILLSGNFYLEAGSRIAISYNYPAPNYSLTTVAHQGFDGSVPELDTTVTDAINGIAGWKGFVANPAGLQSLALDQLNSGDVRLVLSTQKLYYYSASSSAVADGERIIAPTVLSGGIGRWLSISSDVPLTSIGQILTHDGDEVVTLAPGANGTALLRDTTTPTGLRWGVVAAPGGGDADSWNGLEIGAIVTYEDNDYYLSGEPPIELNDDEDKGRLAHKILIQPADNDNLNLVSLVRHTNGLVGGQSTDFPRNSILCTNWGTSDLASDDERENIVDPLFEVVHHPLVADKVLVSREYPNSYRFVNNSLANLSDTYNQGVLPADGEVLTWDVTSQRWTPRSSLAVDIGLRGLSDTQLPTPLADGQGLVYNALTGLWTAGVPNISGVQGLLSTATTTTIAGDSNWAQVVFMLSSQVASVDARGNYPLLSNIVRFSVPDTGLLVPYLSPYGGALNGNAYKIRQASGGNPHSDLAFPCDSRNCPKGQNFCLEFFINARQGSSTNGIESLTHLFFKRRENSDITIYHEILSEVTGGGTNLISSKLIVKLKGTIDVLLESLPGAFTFDSWRHIVVNRSGSTFRLFINGTLQQAVTVSTTLFDSSTIPSNVTYFGKQRDNLSQDLEYDFGLDGALEDVRFTIGVARYTANFTPPTASLPTGPSFQTTQRAYQIKLRNLVDFDSTVTLQDGMAVTWSTSASKFVPAVIGSGGGSVLLTLNDLTNVETTPASGDSIRYNGSTWESYTPSAGGASGVATINGYSGTVLLTTDQITEGSTNRYFEDEYVDARVATRLLSDLADVSAATSPVNNSVLGHNGTTWLPVNLTTTTLTEGTNLYWTQGRFNTAIAAANLADLGNVAATVPTNSQVLGWNGTAWAPLTLTGSYSPPVTNKGDLFTFSTVTDRLPVGTNGQILTADSSAATGLAWQTIVTTPPVTTKGDLFTFSSVAARLPVGTNGQVLVADSATGTGLAWQTVSVTPYTPPVTTKGDIFVYSTTPTRLPVGTNGQVLVADSSTGTGLAWEANSATISELNSVGDVNTNGAVANDALCWSGTEWTAKQHTPYLTFRTISANYTLESSGNLDHGKMIIVTAAAAITLPNGLPTGYQCIIFRSTAGAVTISASGTLLAKGTIITDQNTAIHVTHTGSNQWIATGNLST